MGRLAEQEGAVGVNAPAPTALTTGSVVLAPGLIWI